jgi:hypothetical protein
MTEFLTSPGFLTGAAWTVAGAMALLLVAFALVHVLRMRQQQQEDAALTGRPHSLRVYRETLAAHVVARSTDNLGRTSHD